MPKPWEPEELLLDLFHDWLYLDPVVKDIPRRRDQPVAMLWIGRPHSLRKEMATYGCKGTPFRRVTQCLEGLYLSIRTNYKWRDHKSMKAGDSHVGCS